jgi:MFS family permease
MRTNRRVWIYVLLFILTAINYVDRINLSVASKSIASAYHLSPAALGLLFSSFSWTYLVCLIPLGVLADAWGTRLTTAASIIVWSLSSMLTGAATNFGTLLLTRLGLGIGEAASFPTGLRVVREWAPFRERGLATAALNAGSYAGPAFGAVFVAWLITLVGWRGSFVLTALLGFVWVAFWLVFYHQPQKARWLAAEERDMIVRERDGENVVPLSGGTGSLSALLRCRSMWGVALTQGCGVYSQYLFLTWLPNYLQTAKHLEVMSSGWYTALPYTIAVVLTLLLSRLSDRLMTGASARSGARRTYVIVSMLLSSFVLLTPFVDAMWQVEVLLTIAITFVATGLGMNFTLMSDLLQTPAAAAKAFSILVLGGNVFALFAPIVTGFVVQATGSFTWAFVIAGALLVAGAIFSFTMTRDPISAQPGAAVPLAEREPAA